MIEITLHVFNLNLAHNLPAPNEDTKVIAHERFSLREQFVPRFQHEAASSILAELTNLFFF